MACPNEEQLQDLLTGELPAETRAEILRHASACATCRKALSEFSAIFRAVDEEVSRSPCPDERTLDGYVARSISVEESARLSEHLEECARCAFYVRSALGLDADPAPERSDVEQLHATARRWAERAIRELMPGGQDWVALLWDKLTQAIGDWLASRPATQDPYRPTPAFLAGTLGFADAADPEAHSACVIVATCLLSARAIEHHEGPSGDVAELAQGIATNLGAGKELARRLSTFVSECASSDP